MTVEVGSTWVGGVLISPREVEKRGSQWLPPGECESFGLPSSGSLLGSAGHSMASPDLVIRLKCCSVERRPKRQLSLQVQAGC